MSIYKEIDNCCQNLNHPILIVVPTAPANQLTLQTCQIMSDIPNWIKVSAEARAKLIDSIPAGWRIEQHKLPPDSRLDVTSFPSESGILSQHELDITESFAVDIVRRLAAGEWTSQEVTTAFCKRAAIAHQLVRMAKCRKIGCF
jgi:hypothetical protein